MLHFDIEESCDDGSRPLPVAGFGLQLLAAYLCEAVEARAAVVLRGAPVGSDGAFMLQLEQQRIQGALVDGKKIAADLFDAARNAVAMERPKQIKGFEDHQGQGSLRDVGLLGHWGGHLLVSNRNMPRFLLESNRNVTNNRKKHALKVQPV